MLVDFSKVNINERPVLILRNASGVPIGNLGAATSVSADIKFNEVSTLSFNLPANVDGADVAEYDSVVGMRIIDLRDVGQFILMNPKETGDGILRTKQCNAYSLEYEFTRKKITVSKGTYNFWNPTSPDNTILGIILELMPSWSVGNVDSSLIGKYRTYEVGEENLYNFMKNTLQQSYNCIFDFDTYNRTINVISTSSAVNNNPVYLSFDNLIKEVDIEEDTESVVTRLDVNGAEGVDIRDVNPTGTNKIINLDHYMTTDNFDDSVIEKYNAWKELYQEQQVPYYNLSIEHSLQTMRKVTETAALADLNGELTSLENQQAVIISAIAQNLQGQDALDNINSQINDKKKEISDKESEIGLIEAGIESIMSDLSEINRLVDFKSQFTDDEYLVLDRFLIDDSVSESSFVAESVDSYSNEDYGNRLSSSALSVGGASIASVVSSEGKSIYEATGGTLTVGDILSANIIKCVVERDEESGEFLSTSYLSNGSLNGSEFETACLSISGTSGSVDAGSSSISVSDISAYMYFTFNTSEYAKHSVAWDLFEYGNEVLDKISQPSYKFAVSSANFISLNDFENFKNSLNMGERLYLDISDDDYAHDILTPITIGVSLDYGSPESLTLEFSDTYVSGDKSFMLADLLEQSISMGKSVDTSKFTYSSFVDSGANTRVKEFMDNSLDVSKNSIMSSKDQAITWGDSGIRLRKWADEEHTEYDPKQVWMNNNSILMTKDNWSTAELAIGNFYDENLGDCWGVVAPNIVGTLLAGSNLVIESVKKDGETAVFKVDADGCTIHNSDLSITSDTTKTHILLDPDHGIIVGTYPVINEDGTVNEDNQKFWVDQDGNLYFSGTLKAANGEFTGKVTATEGEIGGCTISDGVLNVSAANITEGIFDSARIPELSADKITSGTLNTGNVNIQSTDGNLVIEDNTIQISDGDNVRVQIGKDGNGDYSINIWDTNGNLMFSQGGITENAIKDSIIRNDMISDDANISMSKINAEEFSAEVAKLGYATIEQLDATNASIENLETTKLSTSELSAEVAKLGYATVENLNVTNANVDTLSADYASFKTTTTDQLAANEASINELSAKKLDAETADITYANIDFSNISKATMEWFYAESGLIENVTVGDATITGNLVGVTIKGDLIEGGTVVADKLVIKGTDGLYYKLNTDGMTTEAEQTEYNSLSGSIITAKSITASKISVTDLVAFGATIGGFKITSDAIHSAVKESVDNTTRGIYLDNDGQAAFGDANNYFKFYEDSEGNYKLEISADSLYFGSSKKSISDAIDEVNAAIELSADSITSTVASTYTTKEDFANLEIGGTNLIRNTATMEGSEYDSDGNVRWRYTSITSTDYESKTLRSDSDYIYQYNFECSGIDANPQISYQYGGASNQTVNYGEEYVVSVDYYCDSSKTAFPDDGYAYIVVTEWSSSETTYSNRFDFVISPSEIVYDKWTRVSFPFVTTAEDVYGLVINLVLTKAGGNIAYSKLKLERGNKATDWSVHPEDVESQLTNYPTTVEMESAITQKADEITLAVSATYTTKEEFNALEVGGRNLIKNSDVYYTLTSDTASTNYVALNLVSGAISSLSGSNVTLSVYADTVGESTAIITDGSESLEIYIYSTWLMSDKQTATNIQKCYIDLHDIDAKRVSATAVLTAPDGYPNLVAVSVHMPIFAKPAEEGVTWTIGRPKLELGNVATDWTPAPEDIETRVTSAETSITQNADSIAAAASRITANETNIASLQVTANGLTSSVETLSDDFDTLGESSGSLVTIEDAVDDSLQDITIYGKSTQASTPTPDAPVDVVSVGDGGSLTVYSRGRNLIDASRIATKTAGGATVTNNGDGSFTVSGSGTTTAAFSSGYDYTLAEMGIITPGTYTFSTGGVSTTPYMGIQFRKADGNATGMVINNSAVSGSTGGTFTITQTMIDDGYRFRPVFYCASGATIVEGTFFPMCYKGEETLDFEPYRETTATIAENLPLRGLPVTSGGNYTDASGQQWICDSIEKYADGTGKYVQRVKRFVPTVVDGIDTSSTNTVRFRFGYNTIQDYYNPKGATSSLLLMSNILAGKAIYSGDDVGAYVALNGGDSNASILVRLPKSLFSDATSTSEVLEWTTVNMELIYPCNAIETPLTAEEVSAFEDMMSYKDCTNVFTDEGADLKVTYIRDTPLADMASRVSKSESKITQLAEEIELKVDKDGVISSINLTPETIKIEAEKIDLVGKVTADMIVVDDLFSQNITATNFNITGGSINITADTTEDSPEASKMVMRDTTTGDYIGFFPNKVLVSGDELKSEGNPYISKSAMLTCNGLKFGDYNYPSYDASDGIVIAYNRYGDDTGFHNTIEVNGCGGTNGINLYTFVTGAGNQNRIRVFDSDETMTYTDYTAYGVERSSDKSFDLTVAASTTTTLYDFSDAETGIYEIMVTSGDTTAIYATACKSTASVALSDPVTTTTISAALSQSGQYTVAVKNGSTAEQTFSCRIVKKN